MATSMKAMMFSKCIMNYSGRNLNRFTTTTARFNFSFRRISSIECNAEHQDENKSQNFRDETEKYNLEKESAKEVQSPLNSRLIRVAIIGVPNSGKSTLINSLTDSHICPVSKRVHTTRSNQKAIFLEDEVQVVFVDTPGLVNKKEAKKFSFSNEFVLEPEHSVKSVDLVAILHDVSNVVLRHKLDPRVLSLLNKYPEKNSILILNKIDLLPSKHKLLDVVRYLSSGIVGGTPIQMLGPKQKESINKQRLFDKTKKIQEDPTYIKEVEKQRKAAASRNIIFTPQEVKDGLDQHGWPKFEDVFMISALDGSGVDLLKNYFVANAKPSPWLFNEEILTDVHPTALAVRIVYSKLLEYLPNEMPYKLSPQVEYWETDASGDLRIVIGITSPNERVTRRIIGTSGTSILKITDETEKVLMNLLHTTLNLQINVVTAEKKTINDK